MVNDIISADSLFKGTGLLLLCLQTKVPEHSHAVAQLATFLQEWAPPYLGKGQHLLLYAKLWHPAQPATSGNSCTKHKDRCRFKMKMDSAFTGLVSNDFRNAISVCKDVASVGQIWNVNQPNSLIDQPTGDGHPSSHHHHNNTIIK